MGYLLFFLLINLVGTGVEMKPVVLDQKLILIFKVVQVLAVMLFFILPSIAFSLLFSNERFNYLRLNINPGIIALVLVFLIMLCALPIIAWTEQLNHKMVLPEALSGLENWMKSSEAYLKQVTDAFMKDMNGGDLALNLFVIAFMAAISEEFLFRGVVQRSIIDHTRNIHFGIWVTAILFSAIHMQFYGFLPRMLLGAMLGYMYVWSGSLWLSIWAHFVNNGTAVVLIYLEQQGTIATGETGEAEEVGSSLALVSAALVAGLLYALYRFEKKRRERLAPNASEAPQ